jgi:hypothetical protein
MHSISGIGCTAIFGCFCIMSFLLLLCVESQLVYLQILLTKMSTRNLPGVKKRPAHRADNLTAICLPNV